jgi:hypothetical protein
MTLALYSTLPLLLSINALCRIVVYGSYNDYGKVIQQVESRQVLGQLAELDYYRFDIQLDLSLTSSLWGQSGFRRNI